MRGETEKLLNSEESLIVTRDKATVCNVDTAGNVDTPR